MTSTREMEIAYATQARVIAILHENGDTDLAHRLKRCMTARRQRYYNSGWPYSCRASACIFCRRAMIRGWWAGFRYWAGTATTATLGIIRLPSSMSIPDGVRWLRRGLRDVRDRTARRRKAWRNVCFAGIADGRHLALIAITHDTIARRELQDVLWRRWPDMVLQDFGGEEPRWEMTAEDAADLGMCRRGVEPLRIVVMPQMVTKMTVATERLIEPMPVVV